MYKLLKIAQKLLQNLANNGFDFEGKVPTSMSIPLRVVRLNTPLDMKRFPRNTNSIWRSILTSENGLSSMTFQRRKNRYFIENISYSDDVEKIYSLIVEINKLNDHRINCRKLFIDCDMLNFSSIAIKNRKWSIYPYKGYRKTVLSYSEMKHFIELEMIKEKETYNDFFKKINEIREENNPEVKL